MRRPNVLVTGSTGMLGSAVLARLLRGHSNTLEASRNSGFSFDAESDSCTELLLASGLTAGDYVINCVGITKAHISEADLTTIERAVKVNGLFPISLARAAEKFGVRVIQVATDCVFSGRDGAYTEASPHDAYDVYGKSKSLGEVKSENVLHLRCSLLGPELRARKSLLFEWVRNLEHGATIQGFSDHRWNGLTSYAFAEIVAGIVESGAFSSGVQHVVPKDSLTKLELVQMELDFLGRSDVVVKNTITGNPIDRTLKTQQPDENQRLFRLGGFDSVPTISDMMEQMPWEELRSS